MVKMCRWQCISTCINNLELRTIHEAAVFSTFIFFNLYFMLSQAFKQQRHWASFISFEVLINIKPSAKILKARLVYLNMDYKNLCGL